MANIFDLPEELLILIFKFYLETETQAAFLSNIGSIELCSEVCKDSVFWKKFDGSLSLHTLKKLSACKILQQTEEMKLSQAYSKNKPHKLSDVEKIFLNMPNLKSIDFSNVTHLKEVVFGYVAKSCPNVSEIKFADNTRTLYYSVSWNLLGDFLTVRGQNLTVLDFSFSNIAQSEVFLRKMASFCPNLLQLSLQGLQSLCKFPVCEVQLGCPKLKVLRLGSPVIFMRSKKEFASFPDLEIFTHPVPDSYSYTFYDLSTILRESLNLKVLDLRGCSVQCLSAMYRFPATHLECLYLTGPLISASYLKDIHILLLKWQSSLRVVELSRMKGETINDILIDAVSMGKMKSLEELNVNGTNISAKAVIEIIENCESLKVLNLTSCREVGRGKMRVHEGKKNIEMLLDQLKM